MSRILLTDGAQRSTLAAVRALGRAGHQVYVGDRFARNLASRSRYSRGSFAYPSPFEHEQAFVDTVAQEADRLRVDLVFPMTDITCAVLAEHRDSTRFQAVIAVPDAETFWRASDKNCLAMLAQSIGVPVPTLHYLRGPADLECADNVAFPCIVKPSRSVTRIGSRWVRTSVLRVGSREELEQAFRTHPELHQPCMIQRVIEGPGVGLFALCQGGEAKIVFAHRRLREKPPWGGVSVLREAVSPEPLVADHATRLLRALHWDGVAMVEFKVERSSGTPYLMEVNARFWGSLQLAVDAGVNFPVEAAKLWLGEPVSGQTHYRIGVRSRWLLGDLDHLLLRLRKPHDSRLAEAEPLSTLLLDFVRFFRRDTYYEVESWRDPGPAFEEVSAYVREFFRVDSITRH